MITEVLVVFETSAYKCDFIIVIATVMTDNYDRKLCFLEKKKKKKNILFIYEFTSEDVDKITVNKAILNRLKVSKMRGNLANDRDPRARETVLYLLATRENLSIYYFTFVH